MATKICATCGNAISVDCLSHKATQIILGGTDYSGVGGSELDDLVKLHLALVRAAKEKEAGQ